MWQRATNITGEHSRFSSLGCTFQGNHLTFTKPCVLLPLQHARKARKSKALGMLMPGAPFARVTWSWKERQDPPRCGPPQHYRASAGFGWLLAHSELVSSKEGLEEELQALRNSCWSLKYCVCEGVSVVISCHAGEWSTCRLQCTRQSKWDCRKLLVLNLILNAVVGPPRLQDLTWSMKHATCSWKKRFLQLRPCNLWLIVFQQWLAISEWGMTCKDNVCGVFYVGADITSHIRGGGGFPQAACQSPVQKRLNKSDKDKFVPKSTATQNH